MIQSDASCPPGSSTRPKCRRLRPSRLKANKLEHCATQKKDITSYLKTSALLRDPLKMSLVSLVIYPFDVKIIVYFFRLLLVRVEDTYLKGSKTYKVNESDTSC